MVKKCLFDPNIADNIISKHGTDKAAVIPILQAIQAEIGYIPQAAMEYISKKTSISPTQIYGVVTFFKQFRLTPVGKYMIKVCKGTACHVKGANKITQAISEELNVAEGETSKDGLFTLESVACLGCCSLAPVITINDKIHGRLTADSVRKVIKDYKSGEKG
jgi:NADH-quinone oxidoreductase subunit E